jgi:hypothetical protein
MAAEDWVSEGQVAPDEGWWGTVKNIGQTADDAVRATANALTFGMADRLAGLAGGEGTDVEVKKSEAARERSPYASIAGDVTGAAMLPGFGAEALAARLGSGALARAGAYGLTGAATGAAQGAGNTYTGNLPDYATNALIGGGLGGALGSAGGAIFGRGPATSRAAVPISSELHDVSQANYGALARSRAPYEPQAFHQIGDTLENQLLAERYHWRDSPATWRALDEIRGGGAPGQLNTGPSAIISPADIEFVRKGLNKIPKTEATATDRASADVVRRALDDFIINPPAGAVLPGGEREAALAAQRALEARGNWAAYKRTQKLDDLIEAAQNTAGATNSGLNLQAELRKGVRTFIKPREGTSPAERAGYIPSEVDALRTYTRGTTPTNILRYASNAMGGGGGSVGLAAGGLGGSALGGVAGKYFKDDPETGAAIGLATPAVGLGLRMLGNRRANAEINQLRDLIARRSPLYDYRTMMSGMQPGPGSPRTAKATRDAIALEMLKQQQPRPDTTTTSDWQ